MDNLKLRLRFMIIVCQSLQRLLKSQQLCTSDLEEFKEEIRAMSMFT